MAGEKLCIRNPSPTPRLRTAVLCTVGAACSARNVVICALYNQPTVKECFLTTCWELISRLSLEPCHRNSLIVGERGCALWQSSQQGAPQPATALKRLWPQGIPDSARKLEWRRASIYSQGLGSALTLRDGKDP